MKGNEYVITVFASATKDGKDLVSKVNNDAFRAFVDARLTVGGLTDVKSVVNVIYPSDSGIIQYTFRYIRNNLIL